MSDLIDRQAAIDSLTLNAGWKDEEGRSIEDWDERKKIWTDLISLIPSAQPKPRWIPVSKRQPDKPGVYWVTVFNREWNKEGTDIVQGAKPPKDEYWDDHKNLYAVRQDGKWVMTKQRVWTGECWSGYGEIQLAWMEMPAPYTEEDNG